MWCSGYRHPTPPEILQHILGPSVSLWLGLQLLWFPELLGPRFPLVKRGLAYFFIGSGLLMLLSWPFPDFDYVHAQLLWPAVVVLICVVAKMVVSMRLQRLRPGAEEEA